MKPRMRAVEIASLRREGLSDVEISKRMGLPSAAMVRRLSYVAPPELKCASCGRSKMFLERDGLCRSCAE